MKAQQAHELTIKSRKEKALNDPKTIKILKKIEKAAKEGLFSITLSIHDDQINQLRYLGYSVSNNNTNEISIISW